VIGYVIGEILQHYDDRYWWRHRYEHRVAAAVQRRIWGSDGVRIVDADWDTLIVLDACRADYFEEVADTCRFDEYERVRSLGSSTPEWTKQNFSGGRFGDIVYVTGNPQISKYAGDAFHGERKTVLPDRVVEATRDALKQYPNKRIIAHFMQPHTPFLRRDESFPDGHGVTDAMLDESPEEFKTMIEAVGRDAVRAAYADNLRAALDEVDPLLDDLSGRTIVTSDHGELFGERGPPLYLRHYGHKTGIRHPDLVEVPWAVTEQGTRRRVRDDGTSGTESDTEKIEQQLEMLGYK